MRWDRKIPTFLALLVLTPAVTFSQAPIDMVVYGDFEAGFTSVANPNSLDGSSPDDLPDGWQRFETFSGAVEGSAVFLRLDNGPSRRGGSSLGILRTGGGMSGDWTGVRQDLSLDVSECSALNLFLDVKVLSHTLEAGGFSSPAFEWPLTVQIDYTTTGAASQIWRHGWYLESPGDSVIGPVADPGTGLIPEFADTRIPLNTWRRSSFDLLAELPQVATLDRLTVGGSGWDFEATVDNVQLVCLPRALELNSRRFRVEADWRTPQGPSGRGHPVQLTEDSGYFWFFAPDNIELQVKALDACVPPFNHYWIFAAGLTNVEVTMRVTDTLAPDSTKTYINPLGQVFETITDDRAFATCDLTPNPICEDFGPPAGPGQVAGVPAGLHPGAVLFRRNGIAVSIHELRRPGGGSFFEYGRIVGTNPPLRLDTHLFGSGQTAALTNLTLGFDFRNVGFTPQKVTFEFADMGGFENFSVNGSPVPVYVGELTSAPCPPGVTCTFDVEPDGRGIATLVGPVTELRVGGQELFLDSVCVWR